MWIMVLLILVMFASFFDRALAGILAENIKRDLNLTDGELGWALGVSFTLFNSILALPIALAADRGYRRTVILASILVWSVMTFLAGFAQNVWQRSEEHTSELQSLMRISYAVFCLKKKTTTTNKYKADTVKTQSTHR